jgi:hypothetical protein
MEINYLAHTSFDLKHKQCIAPPRYFNNYFNVEAFLRFSFSFSFVRNKIHKHGTI